MKLYKWYQLESNHEYYNNEIKYFGRIPELGGNKFEFKNKAAIYYIYSN